MNIQNFKHSANVNIGIELEYFPITVDLCVYRLKSGITSQPADAQLAIAIKALAPSKDVQGFASLAAIESFTQGLSETIISDKTMWLLHADVIDDARLRGFQQALEVGSKKYGTHLGQVSNPFEMLQQQPALVHNVIHVGYADHMLFRLDGTPLPIAIQVGYCNGGLDNSNYDLEKALGILAADERVVIVSKPDIKAIPHYNQDANRTREIALVFSPTQADAIALWEKQKTYGATHPSTRRYEALNDLDLLGLQAGGAMLPVLP